MLTQEQIDAMPVDDRVAAAIMELEALQARFNVTFCTEPEYADVAFWLEPNEYLEPEINHS